MLNLWAYKKRLRLLFSLLLTYFSKEGIQGRVKESQGESRRVNDRQWEVRRIWYDSATEQHSFPQLLQVPLTLSSQYSTSLPPIAPIWQVFPSQNIFLLPCLFFYLCVQVLEVHVSSWAPGYFYLRFGVTQIFNEKNILDILGGVTTPQTLNTPQNRVTPNLK